MLLIWWPKLLLCLIVCIATVLEITTIPTIQSGMSMSESSTLRVSQSTEPAAVTASCPSVPLGVTLAIICIALLFLGLTLGILTQRFFVAKIKTKTLAKCIKVRSPKTSNQAKDSKNY